MYFILSGELELYLMKGKENCENYPYKRIYVGIF